jgi:acetoin utilization deacetylase AcuC-like enzyme
MATGIVYSNAYLEHDPGEHPERPERYLAIMGRLTAERDLWESLVKLDPRPATHAELERCHTELAIERVQGASLEASLYDHFQLDADTIICAESERIARLAAGGACRAIDAVVTGEAAEAFVVCRPPGHHATASRAMGFCLYNNVAIAARYAQSTHPGQIGRVLIVDFDVHHGNGTQDIFYEDPHVFYYSVHQYPWYPGTGGANERGLRAGEGTTLNVPLPAHTPPADYLRHFRRGLDQVVKSFTPDLVLISAGFDAHQSDPLGELLLTDESYRTMTRELKQLARHTAGGRLVSCLEGGYNLETLGDTALAHLAALAE